MPPVTVTVLAGPAAGITCTKDAKAKQKVCLGRNKTGNLIALKDDQVSGKHLELSWADGSWFALDLNSTNGTRQNGSNSKFMEGQKYKLRSGDTLQLGPDTVVQVQFDETTAEEYEAMTVEDQLTADATRLAASIKTCAETSVQQIRRDWAEQRAALVQALAQG